MYERMVTASHHLARIEPRILLGQLRPWHDLKIVTEPFGRSTHNDIFGNINAYYECQRSHGKLEFTSLSLIAVIPTPKPDPASTAAWETIHDEANGD